MNPNWRWAAAAGFAAVAASAIFLSGLPFPLANIDDYNLVAFGADFSRALQGAWHSDFGAGRFRPLYWLFEGALGTWTGRSGNLLHVGRTGCLALAVVLQVLLARRLGAGLLTAAGLALMVNWSELALDVWTRGGPAEAFAQPFALACMLAVFRGERVAPLVAGVALGLAACLSKESYAAWTAGVLLGSSAWSLIRKRRLRAWVALGGAALQFLPAIASGALSSRPGSYAKHVLTEINVPPLDVAVGFVHLSPVLVTLGIVGITIVVVGVARSRLSQCAHEDAVLLAATFAVASETLILGFAVDRYFLPLVTLLALAAARGMAGWPAHRWRYVSRAVVAVAVLVPATLAGGRAYYIVQESAVGFRADERMRNLMAKALVGKGEIRIYWNPDDVERPIGAIQFLAMAGIAGRVQLSPCGAFPPNTAATLRPMFESFPGPVSPDAPELVSTECGWFRPHAIESVCRVVLLPRSAAVESRCDEYYERAVLFGPQRTRR